MSFFGVVLTVLFVLGVFKLIKLYIEFNQVYCRTTRQEREDDRRTLGGLVILLLLFFIACSSDGEAA